MRFAVWPQIPAAGADADAKVSAPAPHPRQRGITCLEMAVRQPPQRDLTTLPVQESGRQLAGEDGPDRSYGYACRRSGPRKGLKAILGDRAENFIVVATGHQRLDANNTVRQQPRRRR